MKTREMQKRVHWNKPKKSRLNADDMIRSIRRDALMQKTVTQLQAQARDLGVKGRSAMNKEELVTAILSQKGVV